MPARAVVILAAGRGTRMKSPTPKVLFDVCGLPAVSHVVRAARGAGATRVLLVVAAEHAELREALGNDVEYVVQDPPLGTGHAVRLAFQQLGSFEGDVAILYGDGPLYRASTLRALHEAHERAGAAQTVLTAEVAEPKGFGRVVLGAGEQVDRIVEELDADEPTRRIREINTGVSVLSSGPGREALQRLSNDNKKGEYYLTDVVALLRTAGHAVGRVRLDDPHEAAAFNSIAELALVRRLLRERIARLHQDNGVDVVDPATTYIDVDVEIGAGATILPCTVIARGAKVGAGCVVGPFANLAAGAVLEEGAEIGNFVEVKRSTIGAHAKAKHLAYLGDARIGPRANVGAGTITANYDGKKKHATVVGEGAFLGSGTVLVAPCEVGAGARTGAGAVVRREARIGPGETWVGVPAKKLEGQRDRSGDTSR